MSRELPGGRSRRPVVSRRQKKHTRCDPVVVALPGVHGHLLLRADRPANVLAIGEGWLYRRRNRFLFLQGKRRSSRRSSSPVVLERIAVAALTLNSSPEVFPKWRYLVAWPGAAGSRDPVPPLTGR
jgi:hypothetical protein